MVREKLLLTDRQLCSGCAGYQSKEDVYHAILEGKNVVLTFNDTSVNTATENPQDKDALHFYCSGGGVYTKITAPLDPSQMDK